MQRDILLGKKGEWMNKRKEGRKEGREEGGKGGREGGNCKKKIRFDFDFQCFFQRVLCKV